MGINIDNNYEPKYIVNSDKKDIVRKLKKESKSNTKWYGWPAMKIRKEKQ